MNDAALDNHYLKLPERFYARVAPAAVPAPRILAWNETLARELGLDMLAQNDEERARIFSGNVTPPGAQPLALAYAGHQFGQFVPQLGDGRAVLLGDAAGRNGQRYDIQLKGSGRTPFSRGGDGKSSLGPVVREYLLSEAMHHLGVPTTRALAAVLTGEEVFREGALPGGVLTRVASSHIRVGSFEYFAARGDAEALRELSNYAIERHYPELAGADKPGVALLGKVLEAHAALVAHWMDIGFVHGVMNTDNTSISGETLDYGPCAFLDEFHRDKVFSSIDHHGRYAYDRQPAIALWNLTRLAECLLTMGEEQALLEEQLARFPQLYEDHYLERMRRKLGLTVEAESDADLIERWLEHLQSNELDYTLSYRRLAERAGTTDDPRFGDFELEWRQRIANEPKSAEDVKALMNSVNPYVIPRNHQVERAIQAAIDGDFTVFHELNRALSRPFDAAPQHAIFAEPPLPEERVARTFCGT